jgi:hypothetical protein
MAKMGCGSVRTESPASATCKFLFCNFSHPYSKKSWEKEKSDNLSKLCCQLMLSRRIVYSILLHSTATLPAMYIGEGELWCLRLAVLWASRWWERTRDVVFVGTKICGIYTTITTITVMVTSLMVTLWLPIWSHVIMWQPTRWVSLGAYQADY